MRTTLFRRAAALLAIPVFCLSGVLTASASRAGSAEVDYAISNPYADVDWETFGQYRANLHTHSIASDGENDYYDVIETHYAMGYDILAITDHGTVDYNWTRPEIVPGLQFALGFRRESFKRPQGVTQERFEQITAGTDRGARGMLRVPFGIEHNPVSLNNAHVNSWFADYGHGVLGGTSDYETPIREVDRLGGLSVINHPGEYTNARDEENFELAYNEDYDYYIKKFARLLEKYPSCIGLDVNSKGDTRTRHDRKLWDILLQRVVPTGRSVFAIASSDAHRYSAMDSGWTIMLMPENSVEALKACMTQGAFFAGSRNIKNAVELEQLSLETGLELGREWYAEPSLAQPVITGIYVDDAQDSISISSQNALTTHWIADGRVIHVGARIDLDDYSDEIGSYVRAEVFGSGGILYTQAFTLDYDGAPEAQKEFFFDRGNVLKLFSDVTLGVLAKSPLFCKIWYALTHNPAFA